MSQTFSLGLEYGARFLCEARVPCSAHVEAGNSTTKRNSYSVSFLDRTELLDASNVPTDALERSCAVPNSASAPIFQVNIFILMQLPEASIDSIWCSHFTIFVSLRHGISARQELFRWTAT